MNTILLNQNLFNITFNRTTNVNNFIKNLIFLQQPINIKYYYFFIIIIIIESLQGVSNKRLD